MKCIDSFRIVCARIVRWGKEKIVDFLIFYKRKSLYSSVTQVTRFNATMTVGRTMTFGLTLLMSVAPLFCNHLHTLTIVLLPQIFVICRYLWLCFTIWKYFCLNSRRIIYVTEMIKLFKSQTKLFLFRFNYADNVKK